MAKSSQFSGRRRLISQLVMVALFGSTLAAAAALVRHHSNASTISLDGPRQIGNIRVRLPVKWKLQQGNNVRLVSVEPPRQVEDDIRQGRVLTVVVNSGVEPDTDLLEFIDAHQQGLMHLLVPWNDHHLPGGPIQVAGATGMIRAYRHVDSLGGASDESPPLSWVVAAILPDGTGIFVSLKSPDMREYAQDRKLILDVVGSITAGPR